MKVTAYPEFEKWRHRIKIQPQLFRPWTGAVYRVTTLNYPNSKSILLGEGSFVTAHVGTRSVRFALTDRRGFVEKATTPDLIQRRTSLPMASSPSSDRHRQNQSTEGREKYVSTASVQNDSSKLD